MIICWNNSGSAYRTLKNDSYTPYNMISSIVNIYIHYAIIWAKKQSSASTVDMMKYIVGGPLIM